MNAVNCFVLLLIGLVCANVGAIRQLEETMISISVSNTGSTTNGIGDKLYSIVSVTSSAEAYACGSANANRGPDGPSGNASGCGSGHTSGHAIAEGPNARATTMSTAFARDSADAAAGPNGATARGNGAGGGTSVASGRIGG